MTAYKKRLCVVEMPGVTIIGTLCENIAHQLQDVERQHFATLEHPALIQRTSPTNVQLVPILTGGIIDGTFIEINLRNTLWIGKPTNQLSSAYQAQRSGLIPATNLEGVKLNGGE